MSRETLYVIGLCLAGLLSICVFRHEMDPKVEKFQNKIEEVKDEIIAEREAKETLATDMINHGANVYIDGQLIEGDKVILDNYRINIVDDYIILTPY